MVESFGMYPCKICGFGCDSYEESTDCEKQHKIKRMRCLRCMGQMDERISINGEGISYYCKHCRIKYTEEDLKNETKRIIEARP